MTIPQNIRDEWKLLREHGDLRAIATYASVSEPTVRKALIEGESSEDVFKKIRDFYKDRSLVRAALLKSA